MRSLLLFAASLSALLFTGLLCADPPVPAGAASAPAPAAYTLTGPYLHDNLAIYLIHGPDTLKGKPYLPLQQAMEQKVVIVHETGDVNTLTIENVSPDTDVYIQSGDIVKGGRQDRTFTFDFILPPKSGEVPIEAFCVEHGRWSQRGDESGTLFGSSDNAYAGKAMKMAAKSQNSQGAVWASVSKQQQALQEKVVAQADATDAPNFNLSSGSGAGGGIISTTSPSSYELTLESKKLDDAVAPYNTDLANILQDKPDVIGYAFAINGKMNSVDIYASHDLFVQLWPKMLKSSIVEAIQDQQKGQKFDAPAKEAVTAVIDDAGKAKVQEKSVSDRTALMTRESKDNIGFDTSDKARANIVVHRNFLTKEGTDEPRPESDQEMNDQRPNPPANPPNPEPVQKQ